MVEPHQLSDRDQVRRALQAGRFLLFKHSPICPISARAFREYGRFCAEHGDVATGWIDVVAQRPVSQWVAELTGVPHQSPQALLFVDGQVQWHASHSMITRDALVGTVS